MIAEQQVEQRIKQRCKEDFLFFTKYFFMMRFGRKFVVGEHHMRICETLEKVYNGEITRLIINIAPRYGKTELAVKNFIAHGLAINPAAKFIHLSYSDDLALDNSEETKNIVSSDTFQALFPEVQIKKESKAKKKWYTTAGGGVYATSAAGQVTGFGAGTVDDEDWDEFAAESPKGKFGGALVIDDPIKPEDADSDTVRERVNLRFDSTISNRVNSRNTPIVIIMQRLHERDLCGYLIDNEGEKWTVLSLPSIKDDGTALWPFKHTIEELREMEVRNPIVFERQHMQRPTPIEGRLYKTFKTYSVLPPDAKVKKCMIDTADTGADFLCSIVYIPTKTGAYVTDVYYTDKGMETTEIETAKQVTRNEVNECHVESNNGGRGFGRNVERFCREQGNYFTQFSWFHQKHNKEVRIFTNAANVQNMIYYPEGWEKMWPKFADAMKTYIANGKNAHDDAPDCVTSIVEKEYTNKMRFAVIR
jgi:predicted phage terminase large subunit-like protein